MAGQYLIYCGGNYSSKKWSCQKRLRHEQRREKKDANEEGKAQDKLCLTLEITEHIDEVLDTNLEEVIGYSWQVEDGEPIKQLHFKGLTPDCTDTAASYQKQSFKLKPDTLYGTDFGDSALFFEFHVINGVPNFTVMSHRAAYENIEGYGIFGGNGRPRP